MSSIVQELQAQAVDQSCPVTDLLRKAKIVASKLDLAEFLTWIENELGGYRGDLKISPYRILSGEPRAFSPSRGWIPVFFDKDYKAQELISSVPCNQAIGELEEIYRRNPKSLQFPYPPQAQSILGEAFGFTTKYTLVIQMSSIAGILDSVRNIILDWSLKLEKAGILGEGLSFSEKEKERAHESNVSINIGKIEKLVGTVGSIAGRATVSVTEIDGKTTEDIRGFLRQVRKHLDDIQLTGENKSQASQAIDELDNELEKRKPEPGRVRKLLNSLKTIAEGVSGNLIAQGIIANIDKIQNLIQ